MDIPDDGRQRIMTKDRPALKDVRAGKTLSIPCVMMYCTPFHPVLVTVHRSPQISTDTAATAASVLRRGERLGMRRDQMGTGMSPRFCTWSRLLSKYYEYNRRYGGVSLLHCSVLCTHDGTACVLNAEWHVRDGGVTAALYAKRHRLY